MRLSCEPESVTVPPVTLIDVKSKANTASCPRPIVYQLTPSVMMVALSPGRSTSVAALLIVSEPDGSMVRSPPPSLRTKTKKLLPAEAAVSRLSVPDPVAFQTKAEARFDVATVVPVAEKVRTGRDCDSVEPVTLRPKPASAEGCTVAVEAPYRNTRHVPATVVVAAR